MDDKNTEQQIQINDNTTAKKGNKTILVILIIVIIALGAGFIMWNLNNKNDYPFYGKWSCYGDLITLDIDSKNFIMDYLDADTHIEAKYDVVNIESSGVYGLVVTPVKRIVNGVEYNDEYTTYFEIAMDDHDNDSMEMMNAVTFSLYECKK